MAETLRELVVALSLDSSNFAHNMRGRWEQMAVTDRHIWRGFCSGIQFLFWLFGTYNNMRWN